LTANPPPLVTHFPFLCVPFSPRLGSSCTPRLVRINFLYVEIADISDRGVTRSRGCPSSSAVFFVFFFQPDHYPFMDVAFHPLFKVVFLIRFASCIVSFLFPDFPACSVRRTHFPFLLDPALVFLLPHRVFALFLLLVQRFFFCPP